MSARVIKLSLNEIIPLLNVLNEVCHGIHVVNFENAIGASRTAVVDFMDKISNIEKKEEFVLILDDFELKFVQKSFEEVFKHLEEWEFQTRIGVTIQEARAIKEKITR